jgi:multiple sugar transport system permease protein
MASAGRHSQLRLTGNTRFTERLYVFFLGRDRLNRKDALWGYIFSFPWLMGFLLLTIGPFIVSAIMSLYRWPGYGPLKAVGLHNYKWILSKDLLFRQSLSVTFYFVFTAVPVQIAVSFLIASLLARKLVGVTMLRSMYYLPSVVTGVAVAFMWMYIFEPQNGPMNVFLLDVLGIEQPVGWLASPEWIMPSFVIMNTWTLGASMIIILAGLKGVDRSLYESAIIDGAKARHRLFNITLPMISPSLFYVFVIGFIKAFQILTMPLVIFGTGYIDVGGPMNAGLFYSLYLYNRAFQEGRMGYACALAWILFGIIITVTAINFYVLGRKVYYEG